MTGQQYEKACNKCGEIILMQNAGGIWKALNKDFTPHKCGGQEKKDPGAIIGLLTGYNSGSATFRVRGGATKTFALNGSTFTAWQTAGYGPDQWIEFSVDAKGFIQPGARNVQQPDWGDALKDPTGGEIKTPNTHNPAPCTTEQPKETSCTSPQAAQPAAPPANIRVTISATVNLQNYENIKVEVEGSSADECTKILIDTLNGFARNPAYSATREMIDGYMARVLNVGGA